MVLFTACMRYKFRFLRKRSYLSWKFKIIFARFDNADFLIILNERKKKLNSQILALRRNLRYPPSFVIRQTIYEVFATRRLHARRT